MKALSVVYPRGTQIARGEKTLEIRSWLPPDGFSEDLLIVENKKFLRGEGEIDPDGLPVAIVKIKAIRKYVEDDVAAACTSKWYPDHYAWELTDVRALNSTQQVVAARGIYEVEMPEIVERKTN